MILRRDGLAAGRRLPGALLALALAVAPQLGRGPSAGEDEPPCGIAPRAKPKRIKGGEGVPPLPLPATPLRRSERKRDPAPPVLMAKLRWGRRNLVWKLPDGREKRYGDWSHDPNDTHRLLRFVSRALRAKYRPDELDLADFHGDPELVPMLYATGSKALRLEPPEREILAGYLRRGGFFLAVAHHGSREFADSIREEAARLFPDRPLRLLPPDHPVYRSQRRLDRVRYTSGTRDRPEGAPWLEGLYLGCRAAIVLSPYDLCCEWDSGHLPEKYPGVKGDDAVRLGVNIIAYAMAYYPLGRFYGRWGRTELEDPEADRGDFVFAQVRHSGHFDPNPTAFAHLLKALMNETTIGARFRRQAVTLADPGLGRYPFLYLTGHDRFDLTSEELAGLRRFLGAGGFLLADSCCGNLSFDVAFRRQMRRLFPESRLEPLPPDHPLFSCFYEIRGARFTTAVRASFPQLKTPFIESLEVGGRARVIYSRFDLGNGWEGEDHPFSLGYLPDDARRLGVNAVLFAMTH